MGPSSPRLGYSKFDIRVPPMIEDHEASHLPMSSAADVYNGFGMSKNMC